MEGGRRFELLILPPLTPTSFPRFPLTRYWALERVLAFFFLVPFFQGSRSRLPPLGCHSFRDGEFRLSSFSHDRAFVPSAAPPSRPSRSSA